jgi:hypothetical protein
VTGSWILTSVQPRTRISPHKAAGDLDILKGILDAMARTVIDLDDEQLKAAARELGTKTKVETVNAALAFVAERRRRAEVFDDPFVWGSPDMTDPEVRAGARR